MGDEVAEDQLRQRLRSRDWMVVDRAIREAIALGARGQVVLVDRLHEAPALQRVAIVAGLGELSGRLGDEALRQQLETTGPGSQDLCCAAVLALAKRLGVEASADLGQAMQSRNGAVRDYAAFGLAAVGDDRCWNDMGLWFDSRARRSTGAFPSDVAVGFSTWDATQSPQRACESYMRV